MTVIDCGPDGYRGDYGEQHRPQIHFSPPMGWMNDPNGLLFYDGEYHLFHQHMPCTTVPSGQKHWGHSVSADMVHWEHLPIALSPHEGWGIWSGSAVVDWHNTSGLQTGDEKVMVAMFTEASEASQQQSIAYSNDRGRTWTMYAGNPVIANPGLRDFRDPKVFWHEASQHWAMVLAAGDHVKLYTSRNLRDWSLASEFGASEGAHTGVWECPDLFELPIDDDPANCAWVLLASVSNGAPNGGPGIQVFIGDFDGTGFTNRFPAREVRWVDHGKDDYAGVTFSDIPAEDGRRVFIGWMANPHYATVAPTAPWRSAMTLPRSLALQHSRAGQLELVATPVAELQGLRGRSVSHTHQVVRDASEMLVAGDLTSGVFEVVAELEPGTASEFGITVANELGDRVVVGFNAATQQVFIDRGQSGDTGFSSDFVQGLHTAPLSSESDTLTLHVFIDWSSIEVFVDGGRVVMTDAVFPNGPYGRLALFAKGGDVRVTRCDVWELASIWRE